MTTTAEEIDRIAPTRRPAGPAVMRQRWVCLVFFHWLVLVVEVQCLVLVGLIIDMFEG